MLEASPLPDLTSVFETAIDLGQCYYELDDNVIARRRLEEVVSLLDEITNVDTAPLLVRAHMLLGLVETYVWSR